MKTGEPVTLGKLLRIQQSEDSEDIPRNQMKKLLHLEPFATNKGDKISIRAGIP